MGCHTLKGAAAKNAYRTDDTTPAAPSSGLGHAQCGSPPAGVMDSRQSLLRTLRPLRPLREAFVSLQRVHSSKRNPSYASEQPSGSVLLVST